MWKSLIQKRQSHVNKNKDTDLVLHPIVPQTPTTRDLEINSDYCAFELSGVSKNLDIK